jgi:hypothetical protein
LDTEEGEGRQRGRETDGGRQRVRQVKREQWGKETREEKRLTVSRRPKIRFPKLKTNISKKAINNVLPCETR